MFQRLAAALLFGLLIGVSGQAAQAAAPLAPTTAGPSIVTAQPTVLAQEDSSSGGSTRVRTRGIGRLIALGVAVVVGVGGWVLRKIKGE